MKKLLLFALVAFLTLPGFKKRSESTALAGQSRKFTTELIKFDRVGVASSGTECIAQFDIDYPSDVRSVPGNSISKWIVSNILDWSEADPSMRFKAFADMYLGRKPFELIAQKLVGNAVESVDDIQSTEGNIPGYVFDFSFKLDYVSEKYITYVGSVYSYTGGAHGMSFSLDATFDRTNGRELSWYDIFVSGYERKLIPIVKEALTKQYFAGFDDDDKNWLLERPAEFELPALGPTLTADGVRFTYQQYEIAPYSMWKPTCVVPYDDLKGILAIQP